MLVFICYTSLIFGRTRLQDANLCIINILTARPSGGVFRNQGRARGWEGIRVYLGRGAMPSPPLYYKYAKILKDFSPFPRFPLYFPSHFIFQFGGGTILTQKNLWGGETIPPCHPPPPPEYASICTSSSRLYVKSLFAVSRG